MLQPRKLTEEEAVLMRARAESVVSEFEAYIESKRERYDSATFETFRAGAYGKRMREMQRDLEYLRIVHSE